MLRGKVKAKRKASIETVRRRCPCCHDVNDVTIAENGDVETWVCHGCGGQKKYRVS